MLTYLTSGKIGFTVPSRSTVPDGRYRAETRSPPFFVSRGSTLDGSRPDRRSARHAAVRCLTQDPLCHTLLVRVAVVRPEAAPDGDRCSRAALPHDSVGLGVNGESPNVMFGLVLYPGLSPVR